MGFSGTIEPFQTATRNRLTKWLDAQMPALLGYHPWGTDLGPRLTDYALSGKLIRGALVPFGYALFAEGEPPDATYDAAVAMELLQSFLLIHDDIMDRDAVRRGITAIHAQYGELSPAGSDRDWYGSAMGTCAGDVAAFLAMAVIGDMSAPAELVQRISAFVSREIVLVGLAQMQDVHHGFASDAEVEQILQVYTYKTGRYTFSLPLSLGALIAGADDSARTTLERLGESLGRVFQIRDDQLGLFGDPAETGKPAGSDVRSDKKTLYRSVFLRRAPSDHPVRRLFGRSELTEAEVGAVREAMHEHGVVEEVEEIVQREAATARTRIGEVACHPRGTSLLEGLLEFNLERRV